MPGKTFDTNIHIARRIKEFPPGYYLSAVVLQKLVAGAADATEIKKLERVRYIYEKAGRLLVPNSDDWWLAGKVINSLQRGLKSARGGLTPKMGIGEKHRILSDVLIARTARRAGVTVITDNIRDFERIQSFCRVRLMSGSKYFGE